jgi:hypothetical protein
MVQELYEGKLAVKQGNVLRIWVERFDSLDEFVPFVEAVLRKVDIEESGELGHLWEGG